MREVKLDSSKMLMDCHALPCKARNDRKKASFLTTPQDFFTHLQIFLSTNTKNTYRILGFLMRNRGFQAIGKGVTLAVMTTDNRAESTIYRKTSEAVQAQRSRFL